MTPTNSGMWTCQRSNKVQYIRKAFSLPSLYLGKNLKYVTSQLVEDWPQFEKTISNLKCFDPKEQLFIQNLVLPPIQSWFITAHKTLITSQALVVFPRALIVILFSFGKWRSMSCHKASRNGLAISFTPSVVKSMLEVRTNQAESHF